jgi:hypothetical protein
MEPFNPRNRIHAMHTHWMIGLAACALALPVEAQTGIALAGVEAGNDAQYAYLGTVLPLPGQALGQGWAQRYWLDYTGYIYEKGPGQEIDARVGGVEAALGYTGSSAAGWWGVYLGARYGETRLSPEDPGNEESGAQFSGKLQIEGEAALSPTWRINGIANHLIGLSSYWSRLQLQTRLDNQLLVGPELIVQGDNNYSLYKLGVFVGGIKLGRDAALTVKAGASNQDSGSTGAYAGVEWYLPY